MNTAAKQRELTADEFAERHLRERVIRAMYAAGYYLCEIAGQECDPQTLIGDSGAGVACNRVEEYFAEWLFATATLSFRKDDTESWVRFVCGNGADHISDYGTSLESIVGDIRLV